jgi:hypothetical protein
MSEYRLKGNVWRYQGEAGWYFIHLPAKVSREIREEFAAARRRWGSIPVRVSLGASNWKTSIFPDTKSGCYLLPLKAAVRKKELIVDGMSVAYTITIG